MIATLAPAYFAMVMATGIVSIALQLQGFGGAARALFWLNTVLYGGLWAATLVRAARYRDRMLADLLELVEVHAQHGWELPDLPPMCES